MGARGFTSNPNALEGHSGYFENFGRGLEVSLDPFKDLGSRYDLVTMGYDLKAYPCGGLAHTSIEAALALRERLAPRLSDITSIHCSVTRNAGQRAGIQYPQSIENAKFSLAYMVAYSLVHGAPMISAFTEEAIRDERVKAVAKTVSATVDPALGPGTRVSPAHPESDAIGRADFRAARGPSDRLDRQPDDPGADRDQVPRLRRPVGEAGRSPARSSPS